MRQDEEDQHFMQQALRLAARGRGHTRPNPMVGCVIVRQDGPFMAKKGSRVIGKGFHHRAGEAHAEVLALRHARQSVSDAEYATSIRGATLYVTLEPCSHHGRTPPCAEAIIHAGVARVVIAMQDPNPKVAGRGVEQLQKAGIVVKVGVCGEEALSLNQPFVTWIGQGRPLVTLKMAASLDGKTATRTGESQWITGPTARYHVQKMRSQHDVVMVGIGTVLADDPRLNCRLSKGSAGNFYRDPIRLVVDSTLQMPLNATMLDASQTAPLWIATTDRAPHERRQAWMDKNQSSGKIRLLICRSMPSGRVNLIDMMNQLGALGILTVLSEAGATLNAALLAANLADRLALFLAPKLIGGSTAPGLLQGDGVDLLTNAHRLTKLRCTTVGEDLLLEGELLKKCLPV